MECATPEFERRQNRGRLWLVFALTMLLTGVEAAAGVWTNSLALLADAGHMLTDAGSLGLSLLAMYLAARNPTPGKSLSQLQTLLRDRFGVTHSTLQLDKPGDCQPRS
jgi:Co/Zn/Cd efflux system component